MWLAVCFCQSFHWLIFCFLNYAFFTAFVFVATNDREICKWWIGYVVEAGHVNGLDIRSSWERDFPHPSTPGLGPAQSQIRWVPNLFPGFKAFGTWRWPPARVWRRGLRKSMLYMCSSLGPSWPLLGWAVPFTFTRRHYGTRVRPEGNLSFFWICYGQISMVGLWCDLWSALTTDEMDILFFLNGRCYVI
jgi:hypothetical protein